MSKAKGFNGYPNWTQWNVSLWINNNEGLYDEAKRAIRWSAQRKYAAEHFLESLRQAGITHTPDGAKYSVTAIRRAMVGM